MKSHRGLASVIGAVFLIAIVIGALSYITYSLEIMGNFSESLITEESRLKDKQRESFDITSIDITANKLGGVIKNTGQIPIKLTTLWIDEQGVNDVVQKFTLDSAIAPGGTVDLINLVDFTINPTKGYNMKIVTSRGDVNSFYINSPSQEKLQMYIRAIPEYIPSEFTTTILFSVINNMSNNNVLYNVTPQLNITDTVGNNVFDILSGPTPISYSSLAPGDVAIFEYSVQLTGDVNDAVDFNATVSNAISGNWVSTIAIVKEVTLATQAGTAFESGGLNNELTNAENILNFHDETNLTPNSEYHMDGTDPSGSGITINPRDGDITFMTANVTSSTAIVNGTWNMRLSYWSNLTPHGISEPDMAWHFECDGCGGSDDTSESTGNISNRDLDKNGSVTHFTTGGPDNDGYYKVGTKSDYLKNEWNVDKDFEEYSKLDYTGSTQDLTTAIWVKIPPTSDNYFPLVHWGKSGDDDEYELSLGFGESSSHGSFVYQYSTSKDEDITRCSSDGSYDYDDNLWHFVVGTRDGDDDCKLYVDGYLADDTETCLGCSGTNELDIDNNPSFWIGFEGNTSNECENCEFASFMHWNSEELSASKIEELYYTNFGDNGTRLDWAVYRTDSSGTNLETIWNGTSKMPFADPAAKSTSGSRYDVLTNDNTYEKYSFYNATFTIPVGNVTLNVGERLKAVLSWPGDNQNLEMNIRIDDDDPDYELPDFPSYMQTPIAYPSMPTFVVINLNDNLEYTVINNGPEGAWFTYAGTRFVITLPDGSESFGGIIKSINGETMDPDKDSLYIPYQGEANLIFELLSNPPQVQAPANERATPGDYHAAIFLSGFNSSGETFLRTITIGFVHVIDE